MIAKIAMFNLIFFFKEFFFISAAYVSASLLRWKGQEIVAIVEMTNFSGSSFYIEDIQAAKIVFAMQAAENTKVVRAASTLGRSA